MKTILFYVTLLLTCYTATANWNINTCFTECRWEAAFQEIEAMNGTCAGHHSCRDDRLFQEVGLYNCDCDSECARYDTCCIDAPFRVQLDQKQRSPAVCRTLYNTMSNIYMVDTCRVGWDDDVVAELCRADAEINDDPLLLVPVTSRRSTYKNRFCAICNDDDDDAHLWGVQLQSESDVVNVTTVPSLSYQPGLGWAVRDIQNDTWSPVLLSLVIPDNLRQFIRMCRKDIISECMDGWTDALVRAKCNSYMAVMYVSVNDVGQGYKNPHCAFCNGVDERAKRYCFPSTTYGGGSGLKDVMFVGMFVLEDDKPKCSGGAVYDSFSKKCRDVKCGANKKFQSGKCQ